MKTLFLACAVMAAATAMACSSKDAVLSFGQGGHVASGGGHPSGSGGSGTAGTAGGTGGAGATGGKASCETAECFAPYECVRTCGGPVEYSGCCACVPPLRDRASVDCAGTGGTAGAAGASAASGGSGGHTASGGAGGKAGSGGAGGRGGAGGTSGLGGAGGSTCAQLRDGYAAALPTAKVCNPILSSRPPCDTSVSSVLGCSCKTYVDTIAPLQPYLDAWTQAGCNLVCTAIACINAQPRICDSTGAASPTEATCRDTPP